MLDLHGMLACSTCLPASCIPFTLHYGEARGADQDALLKPVSRHWKHSRARSSAQTEKERTRSPDLCPPHHDDCCEPESSVEQWVYVVVTKPENSCQIATADGLRFCKSQCCNWLSCPCHLSCTEIKCCPRI